MENGRVELKGGNKRKRAFKGRFPKSVWAKRNSKVITNQLMHIRSELAETVQEVGQAEHYKAAMEAWDIIHSAETLLHILYDEYGTDVMAAMDAVTVKNELRGYYSK